MTDFPRVLFVTPHAFNHLTGGGVTFSNLFRGWPKICLATVHNDVVPTTSDVCDNYFVLSEREIDFIAPLRVLRSLSKITGRVDDTSASSGNVESKADQPASFAARVFGDSAPQTARLSPELERWIRALQPQVLFTILGGNAFMDLVRLIRERFSLPMVVHMMDDWPSKSYRRGIFAPLERLRMRRLLQSSFDGARARLGICEGMNKAFEQRYGHRFAAFQNTVDIGQLQDVVRRNGVARNMPYRVLYVGSVYANAQLASLIDLCHSVARLAGSGFPITLEIASPPFLVEPYRSRLEIDPAIRVILPIEDDRRFYEAISAADALLLPVNFDGESVDFIRYSMPTKVPAYMASGTPILVYGPRGLSQVDYAIEDGWGHVVSEQNPAVLDEALRRILTDGLLRDNLCRRAQDVAAAKHDSARVRAEFQKTLQSVASGAISQ